MEMILRIEGDAMSIAHTGLEISEDFYTEVCDKFERGFDEDDDDSLDVDIDCLDQLTLYLNTFKNYALSIWLSEDSEEIKISYGIRNTKKRHFDGGKKVYSRIEVKREAVTKNLNDRVLKVIDILQEGCIEFGDKE